MSQVAFAEAEIAVHKSTYRPFAIKRVLLLYPFAVSKGYNVDSVLKNGHFVEAPIGLGYVSAYVKKHLPHIEIEIFDANAFALKHIKEHKKCDMDELFAIVQEKIRAFKPDLVGVSCLFDSIAGTAHKHLRTIKEISPSIITVMGGNYPTGVPKVALLDDHLDFIIFSEGEDAFSKLLIALTNGLEPTLLTSGIAYNEGAFEVRALDGAAAQATPIHKNLDTTAQAKIVEVAKGPLSKNIDDYPVPDRSLFDMDFYATQSRHTIFRTLDKDKVRLATLTSSRGCPFKCTFCSSKNFWGQTIRHRSAKLVVEEMKHLVEHHGINTFVFNDDNIMFDRKAIIELCNEMKRNNLNINWMSGGGIQVTAMKEDVIQAIYETGLRQFNLAIETGNPETLKRIKKPLIKGVAERIIAEIRKYEGTWVGSNFIAGFYFETQKDIMETIEYAGNLDLDWRAIYSFQPLRGTEDYKKCVELGYVKDVFETRKNRISEEEVSNGVEILELSTENFTADFVRNANYEANLKYNFIQNRNIKLRPEQAIRDFDYVIEMVPDHAIALFSKARALTELGQYTNALENFSHAKKLIDESRKLETSTFKSLFAMTDVEVKWSAYCEKFGIDVDSEIKRTTDLMQTRAATSQSSHIYS